MKIVLTCGHYRSSYQAVHGFLAKSGLGDASPSRREGMTPTTLQTEILKYYELDPDALDIVKSVQPGKVWHNLAVDLLMGNLDKQNWGWADSRTLSLLDFWLQLDSQIRFLLVYSAPEYAVAQMLADSEASPENIERAAQSWCDANSQMMAFFHRHPERCILANTSSVMQSPCDFVARVNTDWELRLDCGSAAAMAEELDVRSLGARLLKPLLADLDDVATLYDELENSAHFAAASADVERAEIYRGWNQYRRSTIAARELQSAHDRVVAALDLQSKVAAQAQKALEDSHASLSQEHHLTLAQLHQAQEELEKHSLQYAEEREALRKARDEQAKISAEQQRQIAQLKDQCRELSRVCDQHLKTIEAARQAAKAAPSEAELKSLQSRLSELGKENDQLLLQLHQAQEELEQYSLRCANEREDLIKSRDEQAKVSAEQQRQIAQFKSQCDELTRIRDQHLKTIEEARHAAKAGPSDADLNTLESKLKEASQENELLLIQLHQVQEELEHYFVKNAEIAQTTSSPAFWGDQQPRTMLWDMRSDVIGDNWYYAEEDGRWAGPEPYSTLKLPRLRDGRYEIELDIVDAMAPEILTGMELAMNGHPVPLETSGPSLPAVVRTSFSTRDIGDQLGWTLQFRFPNMISPADHGSDDQRVLGIRLRTVKLTHAELSQ
ncbi:MAG TPA: hypothetical protein VJ673_07685 [Aromatoleum sp.]|uniref:hypothetical protein n=1 Tax=Aromatoleum sp. TaxID=2307007 RepID=UPI002B482CBE|nr:hypothetical protein [Aromatoleum sp.]HJV25552.1 hypothetical protein [Aromatoleum sp.]